jgi:hypothetical protein
MIPRHLPRLDAESLGRAAVAHASVRARVERPAPARPRIVSSAHGPLRHILLCYPSYAGGDDVYRGVFVDLFRQLPPSIELTVLAHPSVTDGLQPEDREQARKFVVDLFRQTFDPERDVFFVGTRLQVPDLEERPVTIEGEQWTEVLYAGTGYHQPIFHIDTFVRLTGRSPSGRYRLLVGSPAEADRILGRSPLAHALSPVFDDVAHGLESQGFEVIRNPLPLTYVDDPAARQRFWYFATSNNCPVQIDEAEGSLVWLPTYGHGAWGELAATDDANRRLWEELGFTVHQLADYNVFAQNLGSVHCIKKYVARG